MSISDVAPDEPEDRRDILGGNASARERYHLVECALRVAHAAVARARHEHQRGIVDLNALGVRNPSQLIGDRLDANRLQLEDLRARLDRGRNLLDLGRRHHEHDVRRRLFDRLEEGVERLRRESMDLVDDEDLVAVADRATCRGRR